MPKRSYPRKSESEQRIPYTSSLSDKRLKRFRQALTLELGQEPTQDQCKKKAVMLADQAIDAFIAQWREQQKAMESYQEQRERILELSRQIAAIKAATYGKTTTKYDEPVRVKLLRETTEFNEVLRERAEGVLNDYTGQPTDAKDVRLELADIVYYNTQDHAQEPDARSWLAVMEHYSKLAGVTIIQALDDCIAKFSCRVAHPTLKQQDKKAAYLLEHEAVAEQNEVLAHSKTDAKTS